VELTNAIEAILFVSENPVREDEIVRIFAQEELLDWQADEDSVREALHQLKQKYAEFDGAFELREIAGGYQFLTRQAYGTLIRALMTEKDKKRLSRASLETLSIIAYRQPISKAEIEYIRGVNCDYAVQKLLEKQLVESAGRSDAPGKPLLYKTSTFFMEYFGINSLNDLPKLQEIPSDEEAYQEQFRNTYRETPVDVTITEDVEVSEAVSGQHEQSRISGQPESRFGEPESEIIEGNFTPPGEETEGFNRGSLKHE
jgi:segregation and condensation protein B